MTDIVGTIQGAALVEANFDGFGAREVWRLAYRFAAFTSSDTISLDGVGAAVSARVRDGKTRTLRWGVPANPGSDTADQACYATGASIQALAVSSDDLTGQLSNAAGVILTSATASHGVGVLVAFDVS